MESPTDYKPVYISEEALKIAEEELAKVNKGKKSGKHDGKDNYDPTEDKPTKRQGTNGHSR